MGLFQRDLLGSGHGEDGTDGFIIDEAGAAENCAAGETVRKFWAYDGTVKANDGSFEQIYLEDPKNKKK